MPITWPCVNGYKNIARLLKYYTLHFMAMVWRAIGFLHGIDVPYRFIAGRLIACSEHMYEFNVLRTSRI